MTKQIKQPIANPTHVITTDGTDQISEVGHSTLSVVKEALSLDAVPNLDTTDAVNKAHDQNTDTALDLGGANEVTAADARAHIDATDNPHNVTATQVGLGDVDNVSAADLRDRTTHTGEQAISTVTGLQSALDDKSDKTTTFTAGVGLDGGGDLSGNRTFDLDSSTQSSLGLADTAFQPGDFASDVSYDMTASGLAATDVQGAIDELQNTKVDGDGPVVNDATTLASNRAAGSQIMALTNNVNRLTYLSQQGGMSVDYTVLANEFIKAFDLPSDIDPELAVAIGMNAVGYPVAGGYYAGLIDTLTGNIIAADDYQTGLRYALIVSPKDLEGGRGASPASGLPTGDLEWDAQDRSGEAGCFTRWNGLEATDVIIAKDEAAYEAHGFIADVRSQYPAVVTPGGSEWYLPAMDELELLYRNFKPNNANNRDDTRNRVFPGTQVAGTNPSSAIEGFQYENSPRIPDVTFLDMFKEGNSQAIDLSFYWSTTDADEGGRAWRQGFTPSGAEGVQTADFKDQTDNSVRPVRRVVL